MRIAIIDYDAGNLRSVEKALLRIGEQPVVTRDHAQIPPSLVNIYQELHDPAARQSDQVGEAGRADAEHAFDGARAPGVFP